MATFIARALGHSNVRPAGVTAQNVKGTITVSVRGADFAPVANQRSRRHPGPFAGHRPGGCQRR